MQYGNHCLISRKLPTGIAGIAYADGEYAVVLECDEVREDGTCDPSELVVEVLSRDGTGLSHADIDKLAPVAERLCLEKEDFHLIPQDSMYIFSHSS